MYKQVPHVFILGWAAKILRIFLVFVCAKCLSWFTHRHLLLCDSEVTRGHQSQLCRGSGCGPIHSFIEQFDAETSTWQHTALTRDRHQCPGGIRTHNRSKREATDPRLRPRIDGDGLERNLCMVYLTTRLMARLVWRRSWGMTVNAVLEEIYVERSFHGQNLWYWGLSQLASVEIGAFSGVDLNACPAKCSRD